MTGDGKDGEDDDASFEDDDVDVDDARSLRCICLKSSLNPEAEADSGFERFHPLESLDDQGDDIRESYGMCFQQYVSYDVESVDELVE